MQNLVMDAKALLKSRALKHVCLCAAMVDEDDIELDDPYLIVLTSHEIAGIKRSIGTPLLHLLGSQIQQGTWLDGAWAFESACGFCQHHMNMMLQRLQ